MKSIVTGGLQDFINQWLIDLKECGEKAHERYEYTTSDTYYTVYFPCPHNSLVGMPGVVVRRVKHHIEIV